MRIFGRFVFGAAVVLALTGLALYFLREPIVEMAVRRGMAGAKLENPDVELDKVSFKELTLVRVAAGAAASPDLEIEGVKIAYDWRDLAFQKRLKSVVIASGTIKTDIAPDGRITIAGWSPDPNAPRVPPPFDVLRLDGLGLVLRTPKGEAAGELKGAVDYVEGGRLDLALAAVAAGFEAAVLSGAKADSAIVLAKDGGIAIDSMISGALTTKLGAASGVALAAKANLSSWRGFFGEGLPTLSGEAVMALKSSTIETGSAPSLNGISAADKAAVKSLRLSGVIKAAVSNSDIKVDLVDGPLLLETDRGDKLALTAGGGSLYEKKGDARRFALSASLAGPMIAMESVIDGASDDGAVWRVTAKSDLAEQAIAGVAIGKSEVSFAGDYAANRLVGAADVDGKLNRGKIGRLLISDMPASAALAIEADFAAKTFKASQAAGKCVQAARAGFAIPEQMLTARIANASLCAPAGALIDIVWSGDPQVAIAGAFKAANAHFKLGQTEYSGAPPTIDFSLGYDPAKQTSRVEGKISGGDGVLNRALRLSNVSGKFDGALIGAQMTATAALDLLKVSQAAENQMVAPVGIKGAARLARDVAEFDFAVITPRGDGLGVGRGRHEVRTGRGSAEFDSKALQFRPDGLQPDRLAPALRGVISETEGAAMGTATVGWAPNVFTANGEVALNDVQFIGPGLAVTRTEGVTGVLKFASFAPAATAGEQIVAIRKMKIGALDLENGEMAFTLPGDDTLKIREAEFPWFGGTIGVYGADMKLNGGGAATNLQIDKVDLGKLLEFINVEGLSGEGRIEGVLPIIFEGGRARISGGVLSALGGGVVRYAGKATDAAAQSNEGTALAFEALRELRFEKLAATIDGALDGRIDFKILFEGRSLIPVKAGRSVQRVDSPVKYRVTIDAPLVSLLQQALLSTDIKLQYEKLKSEAEAGGKTD